MPKTLKASTVVILGVIYLDKLCIRVGERLSFYHVL